MTHSYLEEPNQVYPITYFIHKELLKRPLKSDNSSMGNEELGKVLAEQWLYLMTIRLSAFKQYFHQYNKRVKSLQDSVAQQERIEEAQENLAENKAQMENLASQSKEKLEEFEEKLAEVENTQIDNDLRALLLINAKTRLFLSKLTTDQKKERLQRIQSKVGKNQIIIDENEKEEEIYDKIMLDTSHLLVKPIVEKPQFATPTTENFNYVDALVKAYLVHENNKLNEREVYPSDRMKTYFEYNNVSIEETYNNKTAALSEEDKKSYLNDLYNDISNFFEESYQAFRKEVEELAKATDSVLENNPNLQAQTEAATDTTPKPEPTPIKKSASAQEDAQTPSSTLEINKPERDLAGEKKIELTTLSTAEKKEREATTNTAPEPAQKSEPAPVEKSATTPAPQPTPVEKSAPAAAPKPAPQPTPVEKSAPAPKPAAAPAPATTPQEDDRRIGDVLESITKPFSLAFKYIYDTSIKTTEELSNMVSKMPTLTLKPPQAGD